MFASLCIYVYILSESLSEIPYRYFTSIAYLYRLAQGNRYSQCGHTIMRSINTPQIHYSCTIFRLIEGITAIYHTIFVLATCFSLLHFLCLRFLRVRRVCTNS